MVESWATELQCSKKLQFFLFPALLKSSSLALMHFLRTPVLCVVVFTLLNGSLPAQKKKKPGDDEGYIPIILPEGKKKKRDQDVTQTLPPPKELPSALAAATDRLTFEVSPLQGKGLLSAQTREALRSLLRTNPATIVKLRAS